MLLATILEYITFKNGLDVHATDESTILSHIDRIIVPLTEYLSIAEDSDISEKFSRRFGEGGVVEYFDHLCTIIHNRIPEFGTNEFLDRLAKKKDERVNQTHQDIIKLNQDISDHIIGTLKTKYGIYENNFDLTPLKRSNTIAASSSNRGQYEELIIRNF